MASSAFAVRQPMKRGRQLVGASGGYLLGAECLGDRVAADYTRRE